MEGLSGVYWRFRLRWVRNIGWRDARERGSFDNFLKANLWNNLNTQRRPTRAQSDVTALNVKHRISYILVYPHIARISCLPGPVVSLRYASRWCSPWCGIEEPAKVASGPFTHQVRVISGRADADGLGGTAIQIAQVVREVFQGVGGVLKGRLHPAALEYLVQDDVVVGRPGRALDRCVSLQEKVPVARFGDGAVDDGAVGRVRGAVGVCLARRVETGVVAFAHNHDGDARESILRVGRRVRLGAGFTQERQLLVEHNVVLALGNAVTVNQEVLRELLVLRGPQAETRLEQGVQVGDHFLPSGLDPEVCWPLCKPAIYGGHDARHAGRSRRGSGRRVGDIDAHNHGLVFCYEANFAVVQELVSASNLEIELECHIRKVLVISILCKLRANNANVAKAILDVARHLDAAVDGFIHRWQNHEEKLWRRVFGGSYEHLDCSVNLCVIVSASQQNAPTRNIIGDIDADLSRLGLKRVQDGRQIRVVAESISGKLRRDHQVRPRRHVPGGGKLD
jgi:hypothetical protein